MNKERGMKITNVDDVKLAKRIVMPMLLCKNNLGTKYLTINKKYKIENEGDGIYTLIDDIGEISFYSSSRFELVEAQ